MKKCNIATQELYNMAYSFLKKNNYVITEDIVQELVTHAYFVKDKFDAEKGQKSTFFYNAMKNYYMNRMRRLCSQKRSAIILSLNHNIDFEDEKVEFVDVIPDNNKNNVVNDIKKFLNPYLENVSQIFIERFFRNMTYEEISKIHKVSKQRAQQVVVRELEKLKDAIYKNNLNAIYGLELLQKLN